MRLRGSCSRVKLIKVRLDRPSAPFMSARLLRFFLRPEESRREQVLRFAREDPRVPAFPDTARRLVEALRAEDVAIDRIEEIVKTDPGLVSQLLRLASAPLFGAREIRDLPEALLILGMKEVRRMAGEVLVMNSLREVSARAKWEVFWLHSLLVGRLTQRLAATLREPEGWEYLAGLLHDVGKLFLTYYFPGECQLVMSTAMSNHQSLHEAESAVLGLSHAEVSAVLCERWKLHPQVVQAVRRHHEVSARHVAFDPAEERRLATCVYMANGVAMECARHLGPRRGVDLVEISKIEVQTLPGWRLFKEFGPREPVCLELEEEARAVVALVEEMRSSEEGKGGRTRTRRGW